MNELERLQKKLVREIDARQQAEAILEEKSDELFSINEKLFLRTSDLEEEIQLRHIDLVEAQKIAKVGTGYWDTGADIIEWSHELYQLLGYQKGAVKPGYESYLAKVHPDDKVMVIEEFSKLISILKSSPKPGLVLSFEHRIQPDPNSIIWIAANAEIRDPRNDDSIFIWGVIQDITDLKLTQMNLESKQEMLAKRADELHILNKFAVKIADFDTTLELTWHVVEEVVGKLGFEDCVIYLLDDEKETLIQIAGLGEKTQQSRMLVNPLKIPVGMGITGSVVKSKQIELVQDVSKDPRYIVDLNNTGSELCVPLIFEGEIFGVIDSECEKVNFFTKEQVEILNTIGAMTSARLAQIKSQKSLTLANEEANRANIEKSRFLATMSHEIRTPINGVLGSLNLVEKTDLPDDVKVLLGQAQSSGELLKTLLDDVLDLGKLEAGKLKIESQVFEVKKLITQVSDLWRPAASLNNVDIETSVSIDVPIYAKAGFVRIRQILVNFIGNAVKFTKSGKIVVSVKLKRKDRNILSFSVSDTGVGISANDQSKLFGVFSQVGIGQSHLYGGTGMGLAISRQLAILMNGDVGVKSQLGEGSKFWLNIPFENVKTPEISKQKTSDCFDLTFPCGKSPRILVVEDVATNQLIVGEILRRAGASYDMSTNGLEAIEALKNYPFDLVLMDMAMPEMDGISATNIIRALDSSVSNVPIIALTAYDFKDQISELNEIGFNALVSKPIYEDELLEKIYSLLNIKDLKEKAVKSIETAIKVKLKGVRQHKLPELIECFKSDINHDLNKIHDFYMEKNCNGLEKTSHRLKSISGACGANRLMELADLINNQSGKQVKLPLEKDVNMLLAEGKIIVTALQEITRNLPPSEDKL